MNINFLNIKKDLPPEYLRLLGDNVAKDLDTIEIHIIGTDNIYAKFVDTYERYGVNWDDYSVYEYHKIYKHFETIFLNRREANKYVFFAKLGDEFELDNYE